MILTSLSIWPSRAAVPAICDETCGLAGGGARRKCEISSGDARGVSAGGAPCGAGAVFLVHIGAGVSARGDCE